MEGQPKEDLRRDLATELLTQGSRIVHRIPGVKHPGQGWRAKLLMTASQYWSALDFDPTSGTVAAIVDGRPVRVDVEAYMPSVEQWVRNTVLPRIDAQRTAQTLAEVASEHPSPAVLTGGVKAEFSETALGAWFMLRVHRWRGQVAPTEEQDLAAALEFFEHVPRDPFRKVRREKVPLAWRTSGARKPR
jgi:hypothetical protein